MKHTHDEIDRMLDKAAAVVDGEGKILGSRDLTPKEKRAPAVTIAVLDHVDWHDFERDCGD